MPIDKYEKSTVALLAADEKPDASLVSHFLNRYKMVNGCLQERSGPAKGTCVCDSLHAILWAEIAAVHKLTEFSTFMRLFAELGDARYAAQEQRQHRALFLWWCAIDWKPKISPHQRRESV